MIIVEGWVRASAEEVERLRPAAVQMMRATKAEEPGCLEYAYALDLADPGVLRIIERWTNNDALTAHFASRHMVMFRRAMGDAKIVAMSVKVYAGDEVRTLMER